MTTTPPPAPSPSPMPPVVPGRGTPFVEYALRRIRASRVLQACLVVAFMSYGGLSFLLASGRLTARENAPAASGFVALVLTVAFLSLASWFFLFRWYPALERTHAATDRASRVRWVPRALEGFAIGCVVIVHAMLAYLVVYLARR